MANRSFSHGRFVPAGLCLVFLLALLASIPMQMQPPRALSSAAPPADFSAERAAEHLEVIARAPHPTGSAEQREVRGYILRQLRALTLETEEQAADAFRSPGRRSGPIVGAHVINIMARIRGTGRGRAVLLVAHYDSVPTAPGAADDGAGVAALLETARALTAGAALRNDVIFLFTDAEELGLLGAQAFVAEHPWAKDVGLVLNFEARGAKGPSLMFETSAGNAALIREFAAAAPHPAASSFMYDFYRRLPNDTDLTVFKRAGMAGFNFSFADDWPRYHTMGDSLANLDRRSLQHHGSYGVALTRHFGSLDLSALEAGDAVYFTLFGSLLHYPESWVRPLALVAVALFFAVAAIGFSRGRLSWRGFSMYAGLWAVGALLAGLVCQLAWNWLSASHLASMLPYGMAYNSELYAAAFLALTVSILSGTLLAALRRSRWEELIAGVSLWWVLGTGLSAAYSPGGSYLFVWPLLCSLLCLGLMLAGRPAGSPGRLAALWALPSAVAILTAAPIPFSLVSLLSTSGLIPMIAATALLTGLLLPLLAPLISSSRAALPGIALALALALAAAAAANSGYDASHPRATGLFYYLEPESSTALWVSNDRRPNQWTGRFLGSQPEERSLREFLPLDGRALVSKAAVAELDPPAVSMLEDTEAGGARLLRLQIRPRPGARALWIESSIGRILSALINGRPLPAAAMDGKTNSWGCYFVASPEEGLSLTLVLPAGDTPQLRIIGMSDGLPSLEGHAPEPRPADLMPTPTLPFDSSTLVGRTYP